MTTRPAGDFGTWLRDLTVALRGEHASDVPCDGCTACCTASQFIHIEPDETDTLAHIPAELLFPAPMRPKGHVLMGYDERGHCPMLVDGACTIYDHRPRTCRTYDCRIFPAAGLEPDEATKALITERAQEWRFSYADRTDRARHDSVRAAAAFLAGHAEVFGDRATVPPPTALALLALRVHHLFLDAGAPPTADDVRDALMPT